MKSHIVSTIAFLISLSAFGQFNNAADAVLAWDAQQKAPLMRMAAIQPNETRFAIAVRDDKKAWSTEDGWCVDIGEIYQFIKTMSAAEVSGRAPEADESYAVVRIDNVTVISPAINFRLLPDSDLASNAQAYKAEVQQHRETLAQEAAARQQGSQDAADRQAAHRDAINAQFQQMQNNDAARAQRNQQQEIQNQIDEQRRDIERLQGR